MRLTGKTRYRTTMFGKLVLQVEFTTNHCDPIGGSGYYDEYTRNYWRDAKTTDLTLLMPD